MGLSLTKKNPTPLGFLNPGMAGGGGGATNRSAQVHMSEDVHSPHVHIEQTMSLYVHDELCTPTHTHTRGCRSFRELVASSLKSKCFLVISE